MCMWRFRRWGWIIEGKIIEGKDVCLDSKKVSSNRLF